MSKVWDFLQTSTVGMFQYFWLLVTLRFTNGIDSSGFEQGNSELFILDTSEIEQLPRVDDDSFNWPVLSANLLNISNNAYFDLIDLNIVNQVAQATYAVIAIYSKMTPRPITNIDKYPNYQKYPFTVGTCVLIQDSQPNHLPSQEFVQRIEQQTSQQLKYEKQKQQQKQQKKQQQQEEKKQHPSYLAWDDFEAIPTWGGRDEHDIIDETKDKREKVHKQANQEKSNNKNNENKNKDKKNSKEYTIYSKPLSCLTSYQNVRPYTRFYKNGDIKDSICSKPYTTDDDCYMISKVYITTDVTKFINAYTNNKDLTDDARKELFITRDHELITPILHFGDKVSQYTPFKQKYKQVTKRSVGNKFSKNRKYFIVPGSNVYYPILNKYENNQRENFKYNDFDESETIAFNLAIVGFHHKYQFEQTLLGSYHLLSYALPICENDHIWNSKMEIFSIGYPSKISNIRFQDSKNKESALYMTTKKHETNSKNKDQNKKKKDKYRSYKQRRQLLVNNKHVWSNRNELYISSGKFGKWLYGTGLYWLSVNSGMSGAVVSPYRVNPQSMKFDDKYCVNMIHNSADKKFPNGMKINMTLIRKLKLNRGLRVPIIDDMDRQEKKKNGYQLFDKSVLKINQTQWDREFDVLKQHRQEYQEWRREYKASHDVCRDNEDDIACTGSKRDSEYEFNIL